jgi:GNAT superfamily N-acetyltransferase
MSSSVLAYSPLESERFNFNIYRGSTDVLDAADLRSRIIQNRVDIAILRLPCTQNHTLHELEALGFPYIVADTLVYYSLNMEECTLNNYKNTDIKFVRATEMHRAAMIGLVDAIFVNYTTHYASNPHFKEDLIRAGYTEWLLNYINGAGKLVWLVEQSGAYIGFASCSFDEDTKVCEIILNGVLPTYAGKGVYTDIVRHTKQHFKAEGYKKMLISTQIQNYAVQKVWGREGLSIKNAYTTLHINAMLST